MHLQIRGVNISIKAVNKGSAGAKSKGEVNGRKSDWGNGKGFNFPSII